MVRLRWIGQNGLLGRDAPLRHKAKRRRIRTVMQELMYLAARLIRTGRRLKLVFGFSCLVVPIFRRLYPRAKAVLTSRRIERVHA